MGVKDNNQGQKDGASQRNAERNDPIGSAIRSVIVGNDYHPPHDKESKADYDKGFNNAYKPK
jgi:hypothetical protein